MAAEHAQFIRYVLPREPMDELIAMAKHLTWEHCCEIALLQIENGRRVLVRGGRTGIELTRIVAEQGRSEVLIDVEGQAMRVLRLIFHTHPMPTGPSDDDLLLLELLGQERSMLYELFGPYEGTEIRPKRK